MRNNIFHIFVTLLLICCSSCNNNSISKTATNNSLSKISQITFTDDTLSLSNVTNKNVSIFVENTNVFLRTNTKESFITLSFLDLARKCEDINEIAFKALKNYNSLKIKVVVENEIDTTYNYNIVPYYDNDAVFTISGKCAPLDSKYSNPTQTVDIKKWLFRKKEHLDNDNVHLLSGLINQLSKKEITEYTTNTALPVIHSFSGLKYNVKSSIVADHYVLFACSSKEEIEEFVEDIISNDFDLCSKTLGGGMNCYRKANSNGYKCICLVAINNDWSYKIQPLGLVAIDNMAPASSFLFIKDTSSISYARDISSIDFSNNIRVLFPSDKPKINGFCHVEITNSAGNGVECNVSFRVKFEGDVKSVTVKRTKELCHPLVHKIENKVIDLTGKSSPFTFTYMLHLTEGDNYIPIVVEDNHGNKSMFELNENAEFVRNKSQNIYFNNDIRINDN